MGMFGCLKRKGCRMYLLLSRPKERKMDRIFAGEVRMRGTWWGAAKERDRGSGGTIHTPERQRTQSSPE